VSALPLLDAKEALNAGFWKWSLCHRDVPVVEGFVDEEDDGDEADPSQYAEKTKSPVPFGPIEDECGEKGSEVWGEDDESGPDVDFARMIVEKEKVFNEHKPATLRGGREEPVQDSSCHEAFESGGR